MSGDLKLRHFSSILADPRVKTKNVEKLETKICQLVANGHQQLQVVLDFDYTLTRSHKNGTPVDCSWGVLEGYKHCPKEYIDTTKALKEKYLPIELDPHLTTEEKIPHMVTWYEEANKALQKSGVNKDWFKKMVSESNCELRDNTNILFNHLTTNNVPILVLSAGCGDIVTTIMNHFEVDHPTVNVVSNFLEFDEQGNIVGLLPPMIHMYNKSENAIHDSDYFKKNKHRDNIIVMGDSLGDLKMAEGVDNPNVVLTIGFLNSKIEERMEQYLENFDVVLVDDQTMDFPNAVIKDLLKI